MGVVKKEIIKRVRKAFGDIIVTEKMPVESSKITRGLLFKQYMSEDFRHIQVVDFDKYTLYGIDTIPVLEDIAGKYIYTTNGEKSKVVGYDENIGVLFLENPIENLLEYTDTILENNDIRDNIAEDFIYIYSAYNYAKTMNKNTTEYFKRFNIDIFIYNDDKEEKVDYYSNIIHSLFERSFIIHDDDGNAIDVAHIQSQLSFNVTEYNISNKVLRGSMLIKSYKITKE